MTDHMARSKSDLALPRSPLVDTALVVTAGQCQESAVVFPSGFPVRPFGVGLTANLRVSAASVAPLHFFLCFDGETLYAAHALGAPPVSIDGARLPAHWVPVPPSCDIAFGEARIRVGAERPVRVVSEGAAARKPAREPGKPPAIPSRSARTKPPTNWDDEPTLARAVASPFGGDTIVKPLSSPFMTSHPAKTPVNSTLASPTPVASDDPTLVVAESTMVAMAESCATAKSCATAESCATPVATTAEPSNVTSQATSTPAPRRVIAVLDRTVRAWRTMPRIRKVGVILVPVVLLIAIVVFAFDLTVGDAPTATPAGRRPIAAKSWKHAKPARSTPTGATPKTPVPSKRSASAPAPSPTPHHDAEALANDDALANGKTLERRAADAVAVGAFAESAALYDRLAREGNPADVDTFREAARIARRKQQRSP